MHPIHPILVFYEHRGPTGDLVHELNHSIYGWIKVLIHQTFLINLALQREKGMDYNQDATRFPSHRRTAPAFIPRKVRCVRKSFQFRKSPINLLTSFATQDLKQVSC